MARQSRACPTTCRGAPDRPGPGRVHVLRGGLRRVMRQDDPGSRPVRNLPQQVQQEVHGRVVVLGQVVHRRKRVKRNHVHLPRSRPFHNRVHGARHFLRPLGPNPCQFDPARARPAPRREEQPAAQVGGRNAVVFHGTSHAPHGFGSVVLGRMVLHRQRTHGRLADQVPAAAHREDIREQDRGLSLAAGRSQHGNEARNDAGPVEEGARAVSIRIKPVERFQPVAHNGRVVGGRSLRKAACAAACFTRSAPAGFTALTVRNTAPQPDPARARLSQKRPGSSGSPYCRDHSMNASRPPASIPPAMDAPLMAWPNAIQS